MFKKLNILEIDKEQSSYFQTKIDKNEVKQINLNENKNSEYNNLLSSKFSLSSSGFLNSSHYINTISSEDSRKSLVSKDKEYEKNLNATFADNDIKYKNKKFLFEDVENIKIKKLKKNESTDIVTETHEKKNLIDSIFSNDLRDFNRSNNNITALNGFNFNLPNKSNRSNKNLITIKEINNSNLNSYRSNYNNEYEKNKYILNDKIDNNQNIDVDINTNPNLNSNINYINKYFKNNLPNQTNFTNFDNKNKSSSNFLKTINDNYNINLNAKNFKEEEFIYRDYELNENNYESANIRILKLQNFNEMKDLEKLSMADDNNLGQNLNILFKNNYNQINNKISYENTNFLNSTNNNKIENQIHLFNRHENFKGELTNSKNTDYVFNKNIYNYNSNNLSNNLVHPNKCNIKYDDNDKAAETFLLNNINSIKNSQIKGIDVHDSQKNSNSLVKSNLNSLKTDKKTFSIRSFTKTKSNVKGKKGRKYTFRKIQILKNVCDSMTDKEESEEDNKLATNFFLENKYFKAYWYLLNIIFTMYYATIGIFRFTFFPNEVSGFLFYFEIFIDIVFIIDIILHFFSPFIQNDKTVFDKKLILSNYLAGWFFLDVLSSIPLNIIQLFNYYQIRENSTVFTYISNHDNNTEIPYFDYIISPLQLTNNFYFKVFRWLRIIKVIKLFKSDRKNNLNEVIFSKGQKINDYLKIIFVFFILTHISTCLWIFIGSMNDYNIQKSWLNTISNYWFMSKFDIYISSLYFNLLTIYTVGYGDIVSKNNTERIYNIFILSIGNLLFSFGISYLSFLFANINELDNKYQQKMKIMGKIEKKYKIPKNLNRQIKRSIKNMYTKVHMEKFIIFDSLPLVLKRELILSMHKKGISNFIFFKYSDKEFIITVLPLLKTQQLSKNDVLVSIGGIVEEIYLINHGILSICLDELFDNIQISQLRRNFHFGDILIHLNEKSPYMVKCSTKSCEYLTLSKSDYNRISKIFNKIIMKILEFSYEFLEKIEKNKQVILELFDEGMKLNDIRNMIKSINYHLVNRNFYNHFYNGEDMIMVEDFILNNDIKKIKKYSKTKMEEIDFKRFFRDIFRGNFLIKKNWLKDRNKTETIASVIETTLTADEEKNKKLNRKDYRRKSLLFKDQLISMGTKIKNFLSDSESNKNTSNLNNKNIVSNSNANEDLEDLTEIHGENKNAEGAKINNDLNLINEEISLKDKIKKMFGKKIQEIMKKNEKSIENKNKQNESDSLSISEDELQMMNYTKSSNNLLMDKNLSQLINKSPQILKKNEENLNENQIKNLNYNNFSKISKNFTQKNKPSKSLEDLDNINEKDSDFPSSTNITTKTIKNNDLIKDNYNGKNNKKNSSKRSQSNKKLINPNFFKNYDKKFLETNNDVDNYYEKGELKKLNEMNILEDSKETNKNLTIKQSKTTKSKKEELSKDIENKNFEINELMFKKVTNKKAMKKFNCNMNSNHKEKDYEEPLTSKLGINPNVESDFYFNGMKCKKQKSDINITEVTNEFLNHQLSFNIKNSHSFELDKREKIATFEFMYNENNLKEQNKNENKFILNSDDLNNDCISSENYIEEISKQNESNLNVNMDYATSSNKENKIENKLRKRKNVITPRILRLIDNSLENSKSFNLNAKRNIMRKKLKKNYNSVNIYQIGNLNSNNQIVINKIKKNKRTESNLIKKKDDIYEKIDSSKHIKILYEDLKNQNQFLTKIINKLKNKLYRLEKLKITHIDSFSIIKNTFIDFKDMDLKNERLQSYNEDLLIESKIYKKINENSFNKLSSLNLNKVTDNEDVKNLNINTDIDNFVVKEDKIDHSQINNLNFFNNEVNIKKNQKTSLLLNNIEENNIKKSYKNLKHINSFENKNFNHLSDKTFISETSGENSFSKNNFINTIPENNLLNHNNQLYGNNLKNLHFENENFRDKNYNKISNLDQEKILKLISKNDNFVKADSSLNLINDDSKSYIKNVKNNEDDNEIDNKINNNINNIFIKSNMSLKKNMNSLTQKYNDQFEDKKEHNSNKENNILNTKYEKMSLNTKNIIPLDKKENLHINRGKDNQSIKDLTFPRNKNVRKNSKKSDISESKYASSFDSSDEMKRKSVNNHIFKIPSLKSKYSDQIIIKKHKTHNLKDLSLNSIAKIRNNKFLSILKESNFSNIFSNENLLFSEGKVKKLISEKKPQKKLSKLDNIEKLIKINNNADENSFEIHEHDNLLNHSVFSLLSIKSDKKTKRESNLENMKKRLFQNNNLKERLSVFDRKPSYHYKHLFEQKNRNDFLGEENKILNNNKVNLFKKKTFKKNSSNLLNKKYNFRDSKSPKKISSTQILKVSIKDIFNFQFNQKNNIKENNFSSDLSENNMYNLITPENKKNSCKTNKNLNKKLKQTILQSNIDMKMQDDHNKRIDDILKKVCINYAKNKIVN